MNLSLILLICSCALGAEPSMLRGAQQTEVASHSTSEGGDDDTEDKLAYFEARAKETFKDFRGKVDSYVADLNDNETVTAIGKGVRGFYHWALNRDKWESIAIFSAVALLAYTIAYVAYKILATFVEVACLPIRCLTCCCRRRRSSYYR